MKDETLKIIQQIKLKMADYLHYDQMRKLDCILTTELYDYDLVRMSRELTVFNDTNDNALSIFLQTLKLNGRSDNTIKQYRRATTLMLDEIGLPFNEITSLDAMRYFANLSQKVKSTTYNNYRLYTKQFFEWAYSHGYSKINPMYEINKVKEEKLIKKAFSDKERECLFDNASCLRDKAILECLYSTGCRVSELCSINIADINMDGSVIIYGQKSRKERVVYISETAMYYLDKYIQSRNDTNPALFVSLKKYNGQPTRVTKGCIEDICRKLGKKCGITDVHPHRYRRTCATNGLNRGMGLEKVQRYLGHSDISATTIYYDYSQTDIAASHKMYMS